MTTDPIEPDEEDGAEIITLVSDDGEEFDFVFLGVLEHDDEEFGILASADQYGNTSSDHLELYTFYYRENDEGNSVFGAIEDEDLARKVFEAACEALRQLSDEPD